MIALVFALLRIASGSMLHGVVRSSEDGTPLAVAMIEAVAIDSSHTYQRTLTDSAGAYSFSNLNPGSYRLRVSHPQYDTQELEVLLAGTSPVAVDIALRPQPQRLADVRVFAADDVVDDDSFATHLAERDVGEMALSGDALHQDPALASADVLQSFAARGAAVARDEAPTALHVNGATASENAVLLDGVPLFNPYHASGTLSAIDPDVVTSATLHAGAPSAMLGDATGSVIELDSRGSNATSLTTEGAFGARTLRGNLSVPFAALGGSALVSARRSMDAPLSDGHGGDANSEGFQDLFARATIPVGGGELEAFAFHSGDRLAFDAASERADGQREHVDVAVRPLDSPANAFSWTTGTDALQWRSDGDTQWVVKAWRTRFDAAFAWAATAQLHSSYEQLGSSAAAKWTTHGLRLTAGVDASTLDVGYDVGGTLDATASPPLTLHGSPLIVSAFSEARGSVGDRWTYALGVRAPVLAPSGAGLEPRLSLRFAPSKRISLGVGYSRLHQYVQSLRNEESLVDALAGIALPVAAGSSANGQTMPVAMADQFVSSIDAKLSSTLSLSAVGYVRRESGLALVEPVSAEPFAMSAFALGSANSHGMTVALQRSGARLSGELAYSLSSVWHHSGDALYTPDFASAHALSLGLAARVWQTTTLRAAASFHSGLPASVYGDPLEWTPYTPASGSGDLAGTPQHIVGAVDSAKLPSYMRLDLGIRREWGLRLFGVDARVAADASVINVFDRRNALGATQGTGTLPLYLLLPGRSLQLGFEWKH